MNILWIEDFGGGLDRGKATLNLMFQDLISFDNWDEDELRLLEKPSDLANFSNENSALHSVFLCRHFYDYAEFKENQEIAKRIDAVIIDIRLDNNVDFDLPIPNDSQEKEKFHINAGFYIFNDLIHLGFPAEKMCFMTGEKNSFSGFKKQCDDIYIPEVIGFEKSDAEYRKLRQWIKERESDYAILRRGIIEGCRFLKAHIEKDDGNIQFREFIKVENDQPTIEIPTTDIENYLDVVSQLLAIKEPIDQNIQYRLFLRTLVHEWEENIDPNRLKEKYPQFFRKDQPNFFGKMDDIYTFAWLMKMTRNWVSHAILLEKPTLLNPSIIAFLFLINMRAMFKLPKVIQPYEKTLLRCVALLPTDNINIETLNIQIKDAEEHIDNILISMKNVTKNEQENFIVTAIINGTTKEKKLNEFRKKINEIYKYNTGQIDAEEHDFKNFLLQYFWVNQNSESKVRKLSATSDDFLPTLARHIYKDSFS
ncbi:MAG: hypothetical protein WCP01_01875 [Methylococcaceae bacterium]